MSSTAIVKVAFVNDAKDGRKMGNIKTVEGVYYSVPVNMLGLFARGGTYEVVYEDNVYQGRTYHHIKTIKQQGGESSPAENKTTNGTGGHKYGATDNATAERIYVCGALNSFIAAGKIDPNANSVRIATDALRTAWRQTFGAPQGSNITTTEAPPPAKAGDDLNDDIPW